ncbi:hypothetical protein HT102_12460 [Hoyosella sp. G463]|uniref:Rhodanese domain-containing protein n=1 Tax=Lolliginicoccus lacisalsi TaxID=2742202 RepID=A0A927JF00_9ACTN|nr:hypothetical protein [Lolliginicoccus lacisalsi]MBD8507297.1 hypothetical protein [Lolliginicoccus lacisalsi]
MMATATTLPAAPAASARVPAAPVLLAAADEHAARVLDGTARFLAREAVPGSERWLLHRDENIDVWLVEQAPTTRWHRPTGLNAAAITVLAGELDIERWNGEGRIARRVGSGEQASFTSGTMRGTRPAAGGTALAVHAVARWRAPLDDLAATALFPGDLQRAVARGARVIDIRTQQERIAQGPLLGAIAIDPDKVAHRVDPRSAVRFREATSTDIEWIIASADGTAAQPIVAELRRRGITRARVLVDGFAGLAEHDPVEPLRAILGGVGHHRDAAVMAAH